MGGVFPRRPVDNGRRGNPVDPHRAGNVLDLLLAQILKDEGQAVANLIMDSGDEHPAGIG